MGSSSSFGKLTPTQSQHLQRNLHINYRKYQEEGIVAFDSEFQEDILVIPDVLALLGDNPMQSELACHIGLTARLFCRTCWIGDGDEGGGNEGEDGDGDEEVDGGAGSDEEDVLLDADMEQAEVGSGVSRVTGRSVLGSGPMQAVKSMVSRIKVFLQVRRVRLANATNLTPRIR